MYSRKRMRNSNSLLKDTSAVAVVTGTINNLKEINENISEKIKEIEEYQTELARTRNGLDDTRLKNEQIIKNFSALIEV